MQPDVFLYDTTLRDGNQDRKISLSLGDKLQAAKLLDTFGFDYIEGGWPNPSNPVDVEFFKQVGDLHLSHAKVAAFGSTRRPKILAENDVLLKSLVESKAPVMTIFGKSWDLHVTEVIRTTLEENLDMIESSVRFLKENAEEVVYDAEHFFDGYKANPEYALETLKAVELGGADFIVLCDTNGGTMPWELAEILRAVGQKVSVPLGIHAHNDSGVAVANTLVAVQDSRVSMIQGVLNGYGERCGNADLTTIVADLVLKLGKNPFCKKNLQDLRKTSLAYDQIVNIPSNVNAPYVGDAAFAHKGGAHIDGVMKVSRSFEHISPQLVGNNRVFVASDQAGGSLVVEKVRELLHVEVDKKDPKVQKLLHLIKERENAGWHFDSAEASFEMLVYQVLGHFTLPFSVENYRLIEDRSKLGVSVSQASVKLRVNDEVSLQVAEGDGPVNALDAALRKSLAPYFPYMAKVRMDDFKVRVLGSNVGSDAHVRVWSTFGDEKDTWHVAGVSSNIIEASWFAIIDGLAYKIYKETKNG